MKSLLLLFRPELLAILALGATIGILTSCATTSTSTKGRNWEAQLGPVPETPITPQRLTQVVKVRSDLIRKGSYGRRWHRPMKPRFITIHSTQNYTGDAYAHAKALKRGALRGGTCGYLCWHFTVQDDVVIQHIPTNERGEHADFDGPGNRYSIGIEMCEHKGNNQAKTIDRTAQLTASLMYQHNIPLNHVVPHYHWPRRGYSTPHKNCPHFLLDGGRPGETWKWFLSRVQRHYERIQAPRNRPMLAGPGEVKPAPAPVPIPAGQASTLPIALVGTGNGSTGTRRGLLDAAP